MSAPFLLSLLSVVCISFRNLSLNSRDAPDDYGFAKRGKFQLEMNGDDSENKATNATGNRRKCRLNTKPGMTIKITAPTSAAVA